MINDYNSIDRRVRQKSTEGLDYVVYVRRREGNMKTILIVLILADLVSFALSRLIGNRFAFPIMALIIYMGIFYNLTKRGGFGICYKTMVYAKFSNFLYRDKGYEEAEIEKIKYLDVRKGLLSYSFKMSYINDLGKIKEVSFACPRFIVDRSNKRYQKNLEGIYNRLVDLQKVLDKGDF